jgi:hypothetical protein
MILNGVAMISLSLRRRRQRTRRSGPSENRGVASGILPLDDPLPNSSKER